uniref:Solute carrier family 46 member 3 n=1 Tax=Schistocephalus solidus TaxID=70667 RepID=A0A0X3PNJ1_SCHSO
MHQSMHAIILLHIVASFAIVAIIGQGFVTLQYMFFRFSEEAGLPVNATGVSPCEYDNRSTRPDDVAKVEWVQKRSAQVATVCSLITGSLGLLTTIVLGHFSDWKGRKPAAIVNYIGSLISSIIFSLMVILKLPLWMLYLAAIPPGLTGNGCSGFFTLAFTMLSDLAAGQVENPNTSADRSLSQPDSGELESSENPILRFSEMDVVSTGPLRAQTELSTNRRRLILLGVFDGWVGCIFALTQYFAGELIQRTGFLIPVGIILVSGVLGFICLLFMRETKVVIAKVINVSAPSNDPEVSIRRSSLGFQSVTFLRNPMVILGFLSTFFSALILWTDTSVSMLYLMGKPFCWKSGQVGLYMGLRSGSSAVVTAIIFLAMNLCANCCFSRSSAGEVTLQYQLTPSGAEDGAPSQCSRVLSLEVSPATRRYRRRIITAIVTNLALLALSRLVLGTAWMTPFPLHNYFALLALLLGTFAFYLPLLNSLISDVVKPEEHGRFFSAMGFSGVLGMLIGMTVQPLIYSVTTESCPWAVFIFASLVLFLSTVLAAGLACIRSQ